MIVPFPVPEEVTVHQVWSLMAVHNEFEVTVKEVLPAATPTTWFNGLTDNVGAACATVTTTGLKPVTVVVMFAVRLAPVEFWE